MLPIPTVEELRDTCTEADISVILTNDGSLFISSKAHTLQIDLEDSCCAGSALLILRGMAFLKQKFGMVYLSCEQDGWSVHSVVGRFDSRPTMIGNHEHAVMAMAQALVKSQDYEKPIFPNKD